jgi:hypothetical protein
MNLAIVSNILEFRIGKKTRNPYFTCSDMTTLVGKDHFCLQNTAETGSSYQPQLAEAEDSSKAEWPRASSKSDGEDDDCDDVLIGVTPSTEQSGGA